MRWVNISNQPLKMTLYTLKMRQDIPQFFWGHNVGNNASIFTVMQSMFDSQYANALAANRNIGHIAFKLSDIAQFGRYFKIVKVKSFTIQPGQEHTMRKFKRKPEYINTAKYWNDTTDNIEVVARKGSREYIWRVHSIMTESSDAGAATRLAPAYNFQTSYHYRFKYLANDQYNFQPPAAPVTGLTLHAIYPGTSTANTLGPAT